ncbi:MAG: hypothetical protein ACWA5W_03580, partial [Phycisphaerales bacterium]
ECGKWKKFLIDLKKAVHRYKEIQSNSGKIEALVVKVNVLRMAIRMHTMVLTGTPITTTVPEGFEAQQQALGEIRTRSMFDAALVQAARRANIEAFATMRVEAGQAGTFITAESNDHILPVGPDGPDMQPTVWERRWIIERHRAPNGVGVVEQEVYETPSTDLYQFLPELKQRTLESVLPEEVARGLVPSTPTGVAYPLITRLVHEYYDGQPEPLMSESDMDMLDMIASAMSRVDRSMELHGSPKARVDESMIDPETDTVKVTEDAIVDPDKVFEYITTNMNLGDLMGWMNKALQLGLAQLQLSPALVGIKLEGGQMPDTFDKLRLEASTTLSRGKTSTMYFEPALGRVMDIASAVDAQRPLKGYPVAPVGVTMHPGLPKDQIDTARQMQELRGGGTDPLIDLRTAVETIHGHSAGETVYQRLLEDKARQLELDQQSLMLAVPSQNANTAGGAA